MIQSVLLIVHGLGLLALITIGYNIVHTMVWPRRFRHMMLGVLFGGGTILAMLQPVQLDGGLTVDTRDLFLGFAGAFIGPLGATIALVIAGLFRLASGGASVGIELASMLGATCIGLLWGWRRVRPRVMRTRHFLFMGFTFTLTLILGLVVLSGALRADFLRILPYIVCFDIVGSVIFGFLLERERSNARRARRLMQEADHDPLTGAMNRRGLEKLYGTLMLSGDQQGRGLLLIDLDHFKRINDTHGHAFGDEVLKATTTAILSSIRGGDILARIGGEEFVVLLPKVSAEDARRIGERIRLTIRKAAGTQEVTVTASVGASHWAHGAMTLEDALRDADRWMYAAKQGGRDRVVFHGLPAQ